MDSSKKDNIKIDKASFISYKTNNISKDYTLGKTLGQGSFGTVRKAIHKATKQERAIKILKKSAQDEEKFFFRSKYFIKINPSEYNAHLRILRGQSKLLYSFGIM